MFLTFKWSEKERPRGWDVHLRHGTAADTPATIKRERQWLEHERPPYRAYTVEWMDSDAIIWQIEMWYVTGMPNFRDRTQWSALILKCNQQSISVTGTIAIPYMFTEYRNGKHVEVGYRMRTYNFAPPWFYLDSLQSETVIYRTLPEDWKVTGQHVAMQHSLFSKEVAADDNLHPVVTLQ